MRKTVRSVGKEPKTKPREGQHGLFRDKHELAQWVREDQRKSPKAYEILARL